jgi:hypothetical protein
MTDYYMARRRFRGASASAAELDRIGGSELVPQLKQLPGFIRFITVEFEDGTVGTLLACENLDSINRAAEIGRQWRSQTPAAKNATLVDELIGKMTARINTDNYTPGYTIQRLYSSRASEQDLIRVFSQDLLRQFQQEATGVQRYGVLKSINGAKVMTTGWFDSAEHAQASSQVARNLIQAGHDLQSILPAPPEQIAMGKMVSVYS